LPLATIELKNAADEDATTLDAFKDLQTYKLQIPSLFANNEVLVASDRLDARAGTISADWERFMPWRTVEGEELASPLMPQLEVLLRGMFDKRRFARRKTWCSRVCSLRCCNKPLSNIRTERLKLPQSFKS